MTPADEQQRLAALHEYRLLGAAAGATAAVASELRSVVHLAAMTTALLERRRQARVNDELVGVVKGATRRRVRGVGAEVPVVPR